MNIHCVTVTLGSWDSEVLGFLIPRWFLVLGLKIVKPLMQYILSQTVLDLQYLEQHNKRFGVGAQENEFHMSQSI